jgi:hypothetical protein
MGRPHDKGTGTAAPKPPSQDPPNEPPVEPPVEATSPDVAPAPPMDLGSIVARDARTAKIIGDASPADMNFERPEAKTATCSLCNSTFVPTDGEEACPACADKAAKRRSSPRAGYKLCEVIGEGFVVADGFIDGRVRTMFKVGDVAEFSDADIASLPDRLRPAE